MLRAPIGCLALCVLSTSATGQAPFTEESLQRGIAYFTTSLGAFSGYGVMLVDADGDGDSDAVTMGGFEDVIGVYANNGSGQFADVGGASGIPPLAGGSGALAFDYDADGDLDFFFSGYSTPNLLMRNEGGFVFFNDTSRAGLEDTSASNGCAAGDVDGDGWQDLHVPNYGEPDCFYVNSAGTFHEVGAAMGVDDDSRGYQSCFFDFDNDGDLDLYVSNDKKIQEELEMHNHLYENVNGTLVDISADSDADVNIYSMGCAVGDFDGDGLQDLFPSNLNVEGNPLLINQGKGRFRELSMEYGVESFRTAWAAIFFDYDNDTNMDLYVCNMPDAGGDPRNRLYVHGGASSCVDIAGPLGLASIEASYGAAVGDIDNDGDLDIIGQETNNWVQLYINREGEQRNWIKFRLVGSGVNTHAVGARVTARVGSQVQLRQVMAGGNTYKSQNDYIVHFGLDTAQFVDEVRVLWPEGNSTRLRNLSVNQTYVVRQAKISLPDDLDDGGQVPISGR